MAKEEPPEKTVQTKPGLLCVICSKPATRLVDGVPSCEEHAELVYEDEVEAYTQGHLKDDEWLEKTT